MMKPGFPKKVDAEYVRNGHVCIFCMIKPNEGRIHQSVQKSRTAIDFAHQIKWLTDVAGPNAKKIILIMDNLKWLYPKIDNNNKKTGTMMT